MANEAVNTKTGLNGIGLAKPIGQPVAPQITSLKGIGYETRRDEFVQRVTAFKGIGIELTPSRPMQILRHSNNH
jgi:hypothetical protein